MNATFGAWGIISILVSPYWRMRVTRRLPSKRVVLRNRLHSARFSYTGRKHGCRTRAIPSLLEAGRLPRCHHGASSALVFCESGGAMRLNMALAAEYV